jgi:hypothetical protein
MSDNKKRLLEANKELVEKLSIREDKSSTKQPKLTLGEAMLLKYPQYVTPKQLNKLQKLSKESNDSIKLRKVLRTLSIPYTHKYVKNRMVTSLDENDKPVLNMNYGTRIISLK